MNAISLNDKRECVDFNPQFAIDNGATIRQTTKSHKSLAAHHEFIKLGNGKFG